VKIINGKSKFGDVEPDFSKRELSSALEKANQFPSGDIFNYKINF
jgi:hypothetical protein